jgi:hypothetical protein
MHSGGIDLTYDIEADLTEILNSVLLSDVSL